MALRCQCYPSEAAPNACSPARAAAWTKLQWMQLLHTRLRAFICKQAGSSLDAAAREAATRESELGESACWRRRRAILWVELPAFPRPPSHLLLLFMRRQGLRTRVEVQPAATLTLSARHARRTSAAGPGPTAWLDLRRPQVMNGDVQEARRMLDQLHRGLLDAERRQRLAADAAYAAVLQQLM